MEFFRSQQITGDNENAIQEILNNINFSRARKLSIILFMTNFLFLYIDYMNKVEGLWFITNGYKYLLYSHAVLGMVTLFYILVSDKIKVNSANDIILARQFCIILFVFFILSLTAVTSGWIDQKIHGQITVYVIGCFAIAIMFYLKPKVTALLYGLVYVVFMLLLTISQKDLIIR